MINPQVVIDSREQSTMASTWTEYLVLVKGDTKKYRLFTGRYTYLAEIEDYYDEDNDDYNFPKEINGVEVVGQDDEFLVGGRLEWSESSDTVEFDSVRDEPVKLWGDTHKWDLGKIKSKHLAEALGIHSVESEADKNPKYSFPNLSNRKILYSGRRYIAFSVSKSQPFDGYESDYDFVVWDGLYDAAAAVGNLSDDGSAAGELAFSHVEIEVERCESMKEFVQHVRKAQERFFRDSSN